MRHDICGVPRIFCTTFSKFERNNLCILGIHSPISLSLDVKLRTSIQKVRRTTIASQLEEESGVMIPIKDEEVERYVKIVIEEKERLSKKKDESS